MRTIIPPIVGNTADKLLNFEIEKKGKIYDYIRKSQKNVKNIIGYKPHERGIDGFRRRDSISDDDTYLINEIKTNTCAGLANLLNEDKVSNKRVVNRIHKKKKEKNIMDEKNKVRNKLLQI